MRRSAKPAKARVSRKAPKNEGARVVRDLEKRLAESRKREAEALEQQTATSEILRAISSSPTDIQPVLDAVARSAMRLCAAYDAVILQMDRDVLRRVAHHGLIPAPADQGIVALTRETVGGRTVVDGRPIHVADLPSATEEFPVGSRFSRALGSHTVLGVPLLRDGVAIGAIYLRRTEIKPFTDSQIALLQTFADQAVIAIENVRLFKEQETHNRALTEALERETATSEILRVMSNSPTDIQPVLDAVAERATRLCNAYDAVIFRLDDGVLRRVAHHGPIPAPPGFFITATRSRVSGRAVLDREPVQVADAQAESEEFPETRTFAREHGFRTILSVPLLREGVALGTIDLRRTEARPFTDRQIVLLRTFADQAAIAIENVRLFNETQEALEQQTATSEILSVISSSPTDVQRVFDTIVKSVARLCDGMFATLHRFDGELLHWVAQHHYTVEGLDAMRKAYPMRASRETASGRAIIDRTVIHIRDFESDLDTPPSSREIARAFGYRSLITVPMLREGQPVGAIAVARRDGAFSGTQISLLQTFADQAVIAIENVRLLRELEEKGRQLEAASQHKSEFLANMSHELRTPLNAIIGFSEVLSERMFGELNEKQAEYLKDIYASGTHLLSLINDILDLSKIEAGRMELELTDFDLPTALDSALTLVRERAGRRGISLESTIDERLGELRADERKIRQVVLNLLSNAIKFTPEGGRIEVRAAPVDGSVEVSVSDTGVGIAPEDQEAVFEEFRQVGASAAKQEGTGLGLALCRKFVELHGGRIWVTSHVGVGATFTFTIPVRRSE